MSCGGNCACAQKEEEQMKKEQQCCGSGACACANANEDVEDKVCKGTCGYLGICSCGAQPDLK